MCRCAAFTKKTFIIIIENLTTRGFNMVVFILSILHTIVYSVHNDYPGKHCRANKHAKLKTHFSNQLIFFCINITVKMRENYNVKPKVRVADPWGGEGSVLGRWPAGGTG